MLIRDPRPGDADAVAALWHEGWHDAHAQIVPERLVRMRTPAAFRQRTDWHLPRMRIMEISGTPAGFHLISGDELDQFYIGRNARGTGASRRLIADAESILAAAGIRDAWLACAIGNERAARFYVRRGWRRAGTVSFEAETNEGPVPLDAWRFEKSLAENGRSGGV